MMHSFQMMYDILLAKVDRLAVREHYLSKNALKTAILADTIPQMSRWNADVVQIVRTAG